MTIFEKDILKLYDVYKMKTVNMTMTRDAFVKVLNDIKQDAKQDAIDELLDAIKKSVISIEARDRGSDYSTIYNWIEMIAKRVKEQEHE